MLEVENIPRTKEALRMITEMAGYSGVPLAMEEACGGRLAGRLGACVPYLKRWLTDKGADKDYLTPADIANYNTKIFSIDYKEPWKHAETPTDG